MTPGDDDLQSNSAFGGGETATAGAGIGAMLAALASGATLRANELVQAASRLGNVTVPVVGSSCISAVKYNIGSGDTEIHFHDGSLYHYPAQPMTKVLSLINASSKGAEYNAYWRGKEKYIMGKKKGSHMALGGSR